MEVTQTDKTPPCYPVLSQTIEQDGPTINLQLTTQNSTFYPEKIHHEPNQTLSLRDIETVIETACSLKAKQLSIVGGDPMLAASLQTTLELTSMRKLSSTQLRSDLLYLPLHIRRALKQTRTGLITRFYSTSIKIHTQLTKDESSWNTILTHIETGLSDGLDLKVEIADLGQGEEDLQETQIFLQDLGVKQVCIIRQTNMHNCSKNIRDGFTVFANGNVTCCMNTKPHYYGNIHNHGLQTILYRTRKSSTTDTSRKNNSSP